MKRKALLLSLLTCLCTAVVQAENETYTGIIATVEGGTTSYALTEIPTVSYTEKEGVKYANILLYGQTEPTLSIALQKDKTLTVTYSTYTPTEISGITSKTVNSFYREGKKYITGGRLVIVGKDGKLYNTDGKELK